MFKNVIGVEMLTEINEQIVKDKRNDYASGGSLHSQTIKRETRVTPAALLECGHYRKQHPGMRKIIAAKRLMCWECERIERAKDRENDSSQ